MKCKYCGAELVENTEYCVKCGRKNTEIDGNERAEDGTDVSETKERPGKQIKKLLVLMAAAVFVSACIALMSIMPPKPHASRAAGSYDECISVYFTSSKLLPIGEKADLYISVDGSSYSYYTGEEYELNQARTYDFKLYSMNEAGRKSAETEFQYVMDIPVPDGLEVSVAPGTYTDYQTVEILTKDGSSIYFTTDGSEPGMHSEMYNGGIDLGNGFTVIKAFAVNEAGTAGKIYEWEYELNLPVPSGVSFSLEEGTYFEAIQVELSNNEGGTIYYTLDGSDPTMESEIYSSPVELGNGIHMVKAMAVNEYGMPGETAAKKYIITYNKYGRPSKAAVADGYYATVGNSGILTRFDAQMKEEKTYSISNVFAVDSDGKNIYYLSDAELFRLEPGEEQGVKLIDMDIHEFTVIYGMIYFTSSNILYSMDCSGNDLNKYDSFVNCSIAGRWDHTLYLYDSGIAYKVNKDQEFERITEVESSRYFIFDGKLYDLSSDNLICRNLEDGTVTTVKESTHEYYNLDPDYELINSTDRSQTITTYCENIFVCNNTLYVLERIDDEIDVYHLISQNTDRDISTSYAWYAVDLNTGNVSSTGITTKDIAVFDNCIFDGNGKVYTVVQ